jgi:hypothetical protein
MPFDAATAPSIEQTSQSRSRQPRSGWKTAALCATRLGLLGVLTSCASDPSRPFPAFPGSDGNRHHTVFCPRGTVPGQSLNMQGPLGTVKAVCDPYPEFSPPPVFYVVPPPPPPVILFPAP